MLPEINVHIGEVRIAQRGEVLKALLGSCVGIGVFWQNRSICGLAHCLLSESPAGGFTIGAKFVDQAVSSLIALMEITPRDYADIRVVIAGGGNLAKKTSKSTIKPVGIQNLDAAKREINKLGLEIVGFHAGGDEGILLRLDSSSFNYEVESIPRLKDRSR